jgi:acetyl/propionyl-CoA carboxylase alpha subunit
VPGGPGIRIDSGVAEGSRVTPYYDSLLAKLIAWGETRAVAIVRMRRALEEFHIGGVTTNLSLYRAMLDSTRFLGGQIHTRFVEEQFEMAEEDGDDGLSKEAERRLAAALTAALVDHRRRQGREDRRQPRTNRWKMMGRWELMQGWGA